VVRKQIIKIIKEEINESSIEENTLNKDIFFDLLNKEKQIILQILSNYRIRKSKDENNTFNSILFEYKSSNLKVLNNLYNFLSNYNEYHKIYNLFIELKNNIENNKENNKNNLYYL